MDTISVLRHSQCRMAKTWARDGSVQPYDDAKYFTLSEHEIGGIKQLSELLTDLEKDPHACVIRGRFVGETRMSAIDPIMRPGKVRRINDLFTDDPLHSILVEIDNYEPLCADPVEDPVWCIDEYISCCLPSEFGGRSYHWQLSNTAGHAKNEGKLKAHVWFWLDRPASSAQLRAWANQGGLELDVSVFQQVQVHYTSAPIFETGVANPVRVRSGFVEGLVDETVPLDLTNLPAIAAPQVTRLEKLNAAAERDPVAVHLRDKGYVKSNRSDGALNITCPRADLHSGDSTESATVYYPANTGGYAKGHFRCMHAHCQGVSDREFQKAAGYTPPFTELFRSLEFSPDTDLVGSEADESRINLIAQASVPEAQYLVTDQANANRIANNFRGRVLVHQGRWHVWCGTHWKQDTDGIVYRAACMLSSIIDTEAKAWDEKAVPGDDDDPNRKVAEALRAWSRRTEMRSTLDACLGLAQRMLTIPPGSMDGNPWLLNCLSGTIDLRTGEQRPHDPNDYISRCAPAHYDREADTSFWEGVVSQIAGEWQNPPTYRPISDFLRRWFGYCATGSTREQVFVVHYGHGANGKSTIIDTISEVLGAYAGAAAPSLMISTGTEGHPTEIADLQGKRMVTAHETGESGMLREDFVKRATGGDKLKGRYMHQDFFEFDPTHKLQLLTNHKPTIKGSDHGIWRRVLLVPYNIRFGSPEDVAVGLATLPKDARLMERLRTERDSILTWIVAGAVEWYQDALKVPEAIFAACKEYQGEQDRVSQFVTECCDIGPQYEEVLACGYEGLYPRYAAWCKEGGFYALSKMRLKQELTRVLPHFSSRRGTAVILGGRRVQEYITGVRLAVDTSFEDLT